MRGAGRKTAHSGPKFDPRIHSRVRWGVPAVVAAGLFIGACGSAGTGAAPGPKPSYEVSVHATFPKRQRLAEHSALVVTVKNSGAHAIPNVAVTLANPRHRTAQAFGSLIPPTPQGQPLLASRSRPIWIIDRAPGPCVYSCHDGGPGGAATASTNTWALGRLKPGQTARFAWRVTAIQAGRYRIDYTVGADLTGDALAVTRTRARAVGQLRIEVSSAPPRIHVSPNGRVHYR